jgi:DNA mismatch endonuclease, patch repair protein
MTLTPYPSPTSPEVSVRMRANKKRDSKPELAVRSLLHASGRRFRKHLAIKVQDRTIRPDIVFTRVRVAVFIDGCFWHVCPVHGNVPRANTAYWQPKLERNVERDRAVDSALSDAGWLVVRAWEHEAPTDVVARVDKILAVAMASET